MSQKNNEDVKNMDEINFATRNTSKQLKINWMIENASAIGTRVTGPDFYLGFNCLCSIDVEISDSNQCVVLYNKSDTTIKVQRNIKFLDCDGKVIHQHSMANYTIYKNNFAYILNYSCARSQITSLKDDKLIIHCLLKVEGHITTKINFFKTEVESRENLIDDWKRMYNNPTDSDFTLQVGDKIIHAHKTVLLARSAYFRRMFKTEMKEQAENTVLITDVLYPTMQKLVEFLYTGSFPELPEDSDIKEIFDLYAAADKYDVLDFRALCGERLLSAATTGNICQILQLAQRHGDEELKIRAMDFIFFKFDVIENSNAWKIFISSETVLASEVLNFCFKRFKYTS